MKKRYGDVKKFQMEQTLLSNERTMLSYIRTSFTASLFGFALIQISSNHEYVSIGYASIAVGIIFLGIGLYHYKKMKKNIVNYLSEE